MAGGFAVALGIICYHRKPQIFAGDRACRTNLSFPFWSILSPALFWLRCKTLCERTEQQEEGEVIQRCGGKWFMPAELSYTSSTPPQFVLATSARYTSQTSIAPSYSESLEIPFQRSGCNYEQRFIDAFLAVCATDFTPLWTNACCLLSLVCWAWVLRSDPRVLA